VPYLKIIPYLFKLIHVFAQKARDKGLMDAAAAGALMRHSNEGINQIHKAVAARRTTPTDDDSLRSSTDNRD